MRVRPWLGWLMAALSTAGCADMARLPVSAGIGPDPVLPPPRTSLIPTVNIAPAKGWPAGARPVAAEGTVVAAFAEGLDHPRWLYVLPNGDVLVAETNAPTKPEARKGFRGWIMKKVMARAGAGGGSANRITLLRDTDGDGVADLRTTFLEGLNSPFGMALVGSDFYVANTDALLRFPYRAGETRITAPGTKVVDLPAGPLNHHWTKNIIAAPDGSRLYVTVGSNSNVAENGIENEAGRAAIWEVAPKTGAHRIFASGLRNPVGLAWEPESGALWTVVNERDGLGSDLVPDYLTSVRDGGFYGWPYSYFGQHADPRVRPQRPDLVAAAIVPDYALGPHTACLGLAHSHGARLPARFANGMFVGQHGSWNRMPHSGYKVIFVPFRGGRPSGEPLDVLTGFLSEEGEAYGRPVGVALDRQGALLVADDVGNVVWRVGRNRAAGSALLAGVRCTRISCRPGAHGVPQLMVSSSRCGGTSVERGIRESDWKVFRDLRVIALERFCERVLAELSRLAADTGQGGHQRYLAVYKLLQRRDKELARAFDDPRRSTALVQLAHIRFQGLLTEEEFARFSPEVRAAVQGLLDIGRD